MITLTRETAAAVVAPRLPRVNLLPREILEQERFRRVQYGLSGAVLAAAGVVGVLYLRHRRHRGRAGVRARRQR